MEGGSPTGNRKSLGRCQRNEQEKMNSYVICCPSDFLGKECDLTAQRYLSCPSLQENSGWTMVVSECLNSFRFAPTLVISS